MAPADVHEEFRPVPGHPKYRVSNLGRVQRMKTPGRRWPDPDNFVWVDCAFFGIGSHREYLGVDLVDAERRWTKKLVHRVVLEAFVGPCPPGMQCRHFPNHDKRDNRLCNLAWGTPLENEADKKQQGTYLSGEAHHRTKLSDADVVAIRELRAGGEPLKAIARRFGVTIQSVSRIALGKQREMVPRG